MQSRGIARRGDQGDAGAVVDGRAIIKFVVGVVNIPAVRVVVETGPYSDFVVQRTGEYGLVIPRGVFTKLDNRLILPGAGRILGHVLDGATHIRATEQSSLRTFQYFNAF